MQGAVVSQPQITAAIVTAGAAVLGVIASAVLQVWFKYRDARLEREREILKLRRDALHSALEVIDLVFENFRIDNLPPARPEEWDERKARDAWNRMLVYCAWPAETVALFGAAVGLQDAKEAIPRRVTIEDVARFRAQVRKELGTGPTEPTDSDKLWVARLPGSTAAAIARRASEVKKSTGRSS